MTFLGIDIGSSSIKGAVLDGGRVGRVVARPCPDPQAGLPEGHFELDADRIAERCREVINELAAGSPELQGIVFCGQMGGVVLADQDLRAVTRYLSWRDQRVLTATSGPSDFERLRSRLTADDLWSLGNELRPGSMLALLAWLAQRGQLPSSPAWALGIGDYVVARLTGATPRVHPTYALGTLSLHTADWHRELLERLEIAPLRWPALQRELQPVGSLSLLGREVPCYPCFGDQQTALFGAGLQRGELSVNISTGSQVSLLLDEPRRGEFQVRPYFGRDWLATITHLPAGRSLNALVDLLMELSRMSGTTIQDPWSIIARAVGDTPRTDLELDLSFFAGTMGDRGSLRNMRLENLSVGHLFRAAFDNMADNYARCARRLDSDTRWARIVFSGGLPQKMRALRDAVASRLGSEYRMAEGDEETLQGLARLSQELS